MIKKSRKKRPIIVLLIIGLILVGLSQIKISGISILRAAAAGFMYHIDDIKGGMLEYGLMKTKDSTEIYLQRVDEKYLNQFYEEGGSIRIVYKDDEDYDAMDVNALFESGSLCIYVKDKFESRINPVVVHEFGHYIDRCITEDATNPEFVAIADEELGRFSVGEWFSYVARYEKQAYEANGNYYEYFATAYQNYLWEPDFLKLAAPKTYAFFEKNYGK